MRSSTRRVGGFTENEFIEFTKDPEPAQHKHKHIMSSSTRTSPRLAAKYEKKAHAAFILMYETFYGTWCRDRWISLPEPCPDGMESKAFIKAQAAYRVALARCVNPAQAHHGFMVRLAE